jgi:hypothetical protein
MFENKYCNEALKYKKNLIVPFCVTVFSDVTPNSDSLLQTADAISLLHRQLMLFLSYTDS